MDHAPVLGPAPDSGWILAGWVLPLVVAIGLILATAGFGAIFIPVVIVIGLLSTVHRWRRTE